MNIHKLAAAGFFYAPIPGCTDRCIFYASGNALFNWDPADDPWTEYKKWYPQCPHVRRREANGAGAASVSAQKTGSAMLSGIKSFFSSAEKPGKAQNSTAKLPQADGLTAAWPSHIKEKDPALRCVAHHFSCLLTFSMPQCLVSRPYITHGHDVKLLPPGGVRSSSGSSGGSRRSAREERVTRL